MRFAVSCGLMLAAVSAFAGDVSYVVLNRSDVNSLVRVSENGKSITTIANGASGYGLAVDRNGDYIVGAISRLLRVSRSGNVSTITEAPRGSQWMSVLVEPSGDFLVADNRQHALWRVNSSNGAFVRISNYPVDRRTQLEDVGIVLEESGNYLLIEENVTTNLFRVTPQGAIGSILLRGDRIPRGGQIIGDGSGGYLVSSLPNQLFRITSAGEATLLATLPGPNGYGLVRNPNTGEIVVALAWTSSLARINPDGKTPTILAADRKYLPHPVAVIAETGR